MVKAISDNEFNSEVLESSQPVVVDFWAEWCGPCRAVAPFMETLSTKHPSVKFVKVDVDKNPLKASELGVRGIPSIIMFKDGKETGRVVGADTKNIETMVSQN